MVEKIFEDEFSELEILADEVSSFQIGQLWIFDCSVALVQNIIKWDSQDNEQTETIFKFVIDVDRMGEVWP